jgi:hypothetical protein
MAAMSCCWTSSLKERTVIASFTSSGMMLDFVPPWMEPTVTTAGSRGFTSRATMVWSATTMRAAITMGSTDLCGYAPCPPRPYTVT